MDSNIPTVEALRRSLNDLSPGQMAALASMSGVPVHTLVKVKNGQTTNPRIETVRAFVPFISKAKK